MCPWAGGVFSLLPVSHAEPGTTIRAEQQNAPHEDFASGLNNCLTRDGSTTMLANLPMNGNKVTGLATATNPGDAVRFDQLPPAMTGWLASVSSLALTADQFPYATDANTAAAADLTAFGRSLIDDADAAAARTTLGLGTLSTVSPTGTPDGTKFLRDDGSWQETATPEMIEDFAAAEPGAPRLNAGGHSIGRVYPSFSVVQDVAQAVTDCGILSGFTLHCLLSLTATVNTRTVEVSFSDDGGSTWGSWQSTGLARAGVTGGVTYVTGTISVDVLSGLSSAKWLWCGNNAGMFAIGNGGNNSLTIPAGADAFRVRMTGSTGTLNGYFVQHGVLAG